MIYPEVSRISQVHHDRELGLELKHKYNTKRNEDKSEEEKKAISSQQLLAVRMSERGKDQFSYCVVQVSTDMNLCWQLAAQ